MRANVLLIRWAGGWTMVEDTDAITEAGYRIEALLGLGTVQSRDEAIRIGHAELDRIANGQEAVTVEVDPTGADDLPFFDYAVGDTVTLDGEERRVVAMTATPDPSRPGRLSYIPQLGDIIESPATRDGRTLKKMAAGTLGGASRVATPISMSRPPQAQDRAAGTGYVTSPTVVQIIQITQEDYDALDPPDPDVLYVIIDGGGT